MKKRPSSGPADAKKRPFTGKKTSRFGSKDAPKREERKEYASAKPTRAKRDFFTPKRSEPRTEKKMPMRSQFKELRPAFKPQGVLLWGLHAVQEAFLNPKRRINTLFASHSGAKALEKALQTAEKSGLIRPSPTIVERAEIDRMLPKGSVHQGLALDVHPLSEMTLDDLLGRNESPHLIVILDQVTDPHNVGAILRSAAALGADAVIVTERNAPTATGVLAKAACGGLEHVPLISVVNLARAIKALQDESFWCVGLAEEGGKDLSESSLAAGRVALLLGAEGEGLRQLTRSHCDELARLPTSGAIGSLNVSNAAAIALYEVRRQRRSRMADVAN